MKISIIGASGSVGQEVAKCFLTTTTFRLDELCLFYHTDAGRQCLYGMIYDMHIRNKENIIRITNMRSNLVNSDIVIMCGGLAVPTSISQIPISGITNDNNRNMLYDANRDIVMDWASDISVYSPTALLILVTNPVSKLLVDIHNIFPELKTVGCGVTNDSLRVRNEVLKVFPDVDIQSCFVIGEHDLANQTIALQYFNSNNKVLFVRQDFEPEFATEKEKKDYISTLKNKQNSALSSNEITFRMNDFLPFLYKSYYNHRLAHFLYKTHISTALAVREIVEAFILEERSVSIETFISSYYGLTDCILGIPVSFRNKLINYLDIPYDDYELSILKICAQKYKESRSEYDN